jgi:hypothetical protein
MKRLSASFLCVVIAASAYACGSSSNNPTDDGGSTSPGATGGSGGSGGSSSGATGGSTQTGGTDAGTYYWKLSGGYVGQFTNDRLGETITTANNAWTLAAGNNGSTEPVDIGVIITFPTAPQVGTAYTLANVGATTILVNNKKAAGFAAWDAGATFAGSSMQLTFDSVDETVGGAHGSMTATLVPEMFNDADAKLPVQMEAKF